LENVGITAVVSKLFLRETLGADLGGEMRPCAAFSQLFLFLKEFWLRLGRGVLPFMAEGTSERRDGLRQSPVFASVYWWLDD
jgi:hypothetical protein